MRQRGEPVVIVGAGIAGATVALSLRSRGWDGPVVLIGDEPQAPYDRPELSKRYLAGTRDTADLHIHEPAVYADQDIELLTGSPVQAVDIARRTVHTRTARSLRYAHLVLCTGSVARRPSIPGGQLPGVHVLRTLADAAALRATVCDGMRVLVLGMGLVGSEVAATLRGLGTDVVAADPLRTPLAGVLGEHVGRSLARLHADHGVTLKLGQPVRALHGNGQVEQAEFVSGERIPVDLVVAGLGARPELRLASQAGIPCDSGVLVDSQCRSRAPQVYAAGDIAEQALPHLGRPVRVEHWQSAGKQAETVAAAITGGDDEQDAVPWFWSDQYGSQLQFAGLPRPQLPAIVRGELDEHDFLACYLDGRRVVAVAGMRRGRQVRAAKKLIHSGVPVDIDALRDDAVPLDQVHSTVDFAASRE